MTQAIGFTNTVSHHGLWKELFIWNIEEHRLKTQNSQWDFEKEKCDISVDISLHNLQKGK